MTLSMRSENEQRPVELDLTLVTRYAATFISRTDLYPVQQPDGRYITLHKPLGLSLIMQHLLGQITLGAYLLDVTSTAKSICLDADTDETWQGLLTLARSLQQQNIPAYLELSRRGGHLWLFTEPLDGSFARRFGKQLLAEHQLSSVELYPKQDQLVSGPGSLVRLPLGIHRLTGRKYHFITPDGEPLAPTFREQITLLASPSRVPFGFIMSLLVKTLPSVEAPKPILERNPTSPAPGHTLSERIKARISVLDFISEYVQLDTKHTGFCPFHDDQKQSFSVNVEQNYWHCFAGCPGQTVIDFWMLWRAKYGQEGSFTATIKELRDMLF